MIPIEAGTFHEEQIDELFSSLLGRTFVTKQDDEEEDLASGQNENLGGAVEVGSLRIF